MKYKIFIKVVVIMLSLNVQSQVLDSTVKVSRSVFPNAPDVKVTEIFQYNSLGLVTDLYVISSFFNDTIQYYKYFYDQNNDTVSVTNKARAFLSPYNLENKSQRLYTYDFSSQVKDIITKTWNENTNEWENSEKTCYQYYLNNSLREDVRLSWDVNTMLWDTIFRYEYVSYNLDDNVLQKKQRFYDASTNSWPTIYYQFDYIYDGSGRLIEMIETDQNITAQYNRNKYTWEYIGLFEKKVDYNWDYTNSNWKAFQEHHIKYMQLNAKVLREEYKRYSSSNLLIDSIAYYYTNTSLGGVEMKQKQLDFAIYPTISQEAVPITVKLTKHQNSLNLKMINLSGVVVFENEINEEVKIPTKNLNKGVYFVTVSSKVYSITKKIIVN